MEKINGNSLLMKEVNINILRNALRKEKYFTKQKLAEITGLSIVTVGTILNQFLETGEVFEDELVSSKGGRPAHRFCYNKNYSNILTLYTYEKNKEDTLAVIVSNILGEEIFRREEILENPDWRFFTDIVDEVIEKYPLIKALGISMPGQEIKGKIVIHEYDKLSNFNFIEYFKKRYNFPVIFENDVNAAVTGYCKRENNLFNTSVVYIYFPEKYPPGAGIYINGKVYKGYMGTAGEIKYIPLGIEWEKINYISDEKTAENISKLISAVSAVLNPEKIVICGNFITENILNRAEKISKEILKEIFVPEIIISKNFIFDFETGIKELTLDLLIPKLSVQNK